MGRKDAQTYQNTSSSSSLSQTLTNLDDSDSSLLLTIVLIAPLSSLSLLVLFIKKQDIIDSVDIYAKNCLKLVRWYNI